MQNYSEAWNYMTRSDCYAYKLGGPLYHTVQDYRSILELGLAGVIEKIENHIDEIKREKITSLDALERINHYQAMIIAARGLIAYAHRCARAAEQEVERIQKRDPSRAAELKEAAATCRKIPEHPAESWQEALQSLHLLHMATGLAEGGNSHSVGRFDQYLLSFLEHDLQYGRIDLPQAQELLECFFLKCNESQTAPIVSSMDGVGNNDKLTIGGVDVEGEDASNRLSTMVLEAHAHVHLTDPNVSVRLHKNTPERFLRNVLEVVRLGGGLPILIIDEAIVPALMANGVSLGEARNYADLGCQENITDPNVSPGSDTHGHNNAGWFNMVKPIELALHNGVNTVNGEQVGPRTGDPRSFKTFDEFSAAVYEQYHCAVRTSVLLNDVIEYVFSRYFPCVFHNLMHCGPRESGVTINAGGCKYNWTGSLAVGTANIGDIMSAVDYLVYEEEELAWDELLDALTHDWEGCETVRRKCLEAPKYGTDNDWADEHLREVLGLFFKAYESFPTPRGGRFVCGLISMASYIEMGRSTAATPDGRRNGDPLADSTAPSSFAESLGPIAAHRSAAKAIDTMHTVNGITFNQRLTLSSVSTERGLSKWVDLVRTFVETGGQSVQYTVVNRDTLIAAQEDPARYNDLVVRVGGYSARFTELDKGLQESIIARVPGGV
jgi:formate C-acetyltransferase